MVWGIFTERFSGGGVDPTSPNLARKKAIIAALQFVWDLAAFLNAGSSKLSDVENNAKFITLTPLWKSGEELSKERKELDWNGDTHYSEPQIFFAHFGSLKHFAASARLKFCSLRLEYFSAQLLRLRLPGLMTATANLILHNFFFLP